MILDPNSSAGYATAQSNQTQLGLMRQTQLLSHQLAQVVSENGVRTCHWEHKPCTVAKELKTALLEEPSSLSADKIMWHR